METGPLPLTVHALPAMDLFLPCSPAPPAAAPARSVETSPPTPKVNSGHGMLQSHRADESQPTARSTDPEREVWAGDLKLLKFSGCSNSFMSREVEGMMLPSDFKGFCRRLAKYRGTFSCREGESSQIQSLCKRAPDTLALQTCCCRFLFLCLFSTH